MTKQQWLILESTIGIILNLTLFAIKFYVGTITGSLALISDAWNYFTDSFSSIVIIITANSSNKPADAEHPFGHGQLETVVTLFLGFLIACVAFTFAKDGFFALKNHEGAEYSNLAIIVTIISLVAKECMARFAFWAGKKANSGVLIADGENHRSDVLGGIVVLVGVLAGVFFGDEFWWIDGVLTLIVSAIIFKAALGVIMEASNQLIGKSLPSDKIDEIKSIGKELGFNTDMFHNFSMHRYGDYYEIIFHIRLPANISLYQAHHQSELLERAINERIEGFNTTIHTEPLMV